MSYPALSYCRGVKFDSPVLEHTPNSTQRRTYSKTFIISVFRVVLSGPHTRSTEYEFEYEYEKSFITSGAWTLSILLAVYSNNKKSDKKISDHNTYLNCIKIVLQCFNMQNHLWKSFSFLLKFETIKDKIKEMCLASSSYDVEIFMKA